MSASGFIRIRLTHLACGLLLALVFGARFLLRTERPADTPSTASVAEEAQTPSNAPARARSSKRVPPLKQAPMPFGPPVAAESSTRKALDRAFKIKDPIERSVEVGRLMAELFVRGPDDAVSYLRTMPRGVEFNNALFMMAGEIATNDAPRAIALAVGLATNAEQRVVFNVLFDSFARRDVREAVRNLALVPAGEERVNAIRAMASRWADKNLESALDWAQKLEDPEDRIPAMESVLWGLAQDDPWRTLDLAARSLDDGPLERTVARVLQRIGEVDMQRASDLVKILPAGETQTHLALDLSRRFAADSPESALAWSSALPSEEMQQLALNNILDVWVESAATGAAHYVSHLPEGDEQDSAARHLGERYAGKNPDAALHWAQSLSSESAREAALIGVANGWAQQDAPAAVRWASELPPEHPVRFEAVCSAISYWALSDPTAARAFARDLSPATLRRAALKAAGE